MVCGWGVGGGTKAASESEEEEETPATGACEDGSAIADPFCCLGFFVLPDSPPPSSEYRRGLTFSKMRSRCCHPREVVYLEERPSAFPFASSELSAAWDVHPRSHPAPRDSWRGLVCCLHVSSVWDPPPLKCQQSVWRRDKLTDQSGSSSFIIHSRPIQSLQAHGHRELSSMPPLIIRLHQRLFALSNQCLYNSALPPQETTNEYFMSPLIQS